MKCNVNLRKLLSVHKSHVRETSLFTDAKGMYKYRRHVRAQKEILS